MSKIKYTEKIKLMVVKYINYGHTLNETSKKFNIGKGNIQKWRDLYEKYGINGLNVKQNNHNKYSGEFKIHVIEYKHKHQLSARQTSAYFNIPSYKSVLDWEKKYKCKGREAMLVENRGKANYGSGTIKGKRPRFTKKSKLETLYKENQRLKMENEYLKKLNALIQQKEKFQL